MLRKLPGAEQVADAAAQHRQPPVRGRGDPLDAELAGDADLDQPAALVLARLGEGVRERRAAVAHVFGQGLLAVQMAERDVAEPVENRHRHLPDAADGDVPFGVAARSPGHPGMGHQHRARHRAGARIGADQGGRVTEHRRVAPGGRRRVRAGLRVRSLRVRGLAVGAATGTMAGVLAGSVLAGSVLAGSVLAGGGQAQAGRGLQVRDSVDGDRPVVVMEHNGIGERGRPGPQVHARGVDQRAAEPKPAGGVVVAADHDDLGGCLAQPDKGLLAQRHRVNGRDGAVVDVAGDQHGVHPFGSRRLRQMVEERGLRVAQVGPVQRPSEVPV